MGENTCYSKSVLVNGHHYFISFGLRLMKHRLENQNHEFHGRVIVVVQKNLVQGRLFNLWLTLRQYPVLRLFIVIFGPIWHWNHPEKSAQSESYHIEVEHQLPYEPSILPAYK